MSEGLVPDGITSASISSVVDAFYGRVQADPLLGPVFARHVDDWRPHLARMKTFWRSVLLSTHEFRRSPRGAPPQLHAEIIDLSTTHFERWLALFDEVVHEQLDAQSAHAWHARASNIGRILSSRAGLTPPIGVT